MSTVVDALSFVGPSLFGREQPPEPPEALVARMDEVGVDAAVVAPHRPPGYHLGPANAWLAEAVAASGGRLFGLARIDPNQKDAPEQAAHALGELGLCGVLLHPREEVFPIDGPWTDAVVEMAAAHRRPVVVSAGWPWVAEALQIAEVAARHPGVCFAMTNGGQFNISGLGQLDAELALRRCPNLVIFTNGVYRQDFLQRAAVEFGAERVLFAAAGPQFDLAFELHRVRSADMSSEAHRDRMLGANAAALYGLPR